MVCLIEYETTDIYVGKLIDENTFSVVEDHVIKHLEKKLDIILANLREINIKLKKL